MKNDKTAPTSDSKGVAIRDILMRELHPFMCSDHTDRCIGYPDHKIEVDETVEAILALLAQEVKKKDDEHLEIYKWLLGMGGDFPTPEPGKQYNWRSELRRRLPNNILERLG